MGDRSGGVALIFALSLPVITVVGLGAIQLGQVYSDKAKIADVADAAALDGARQLQIAGQSGAAARAQSFAIAQLQPLAQRVGLTVAAQAVNSGSGVQVSISGTEASFFGNLLPLGGFKFSANATAEAANQVPLCVLATRTNFFFPPIYATSTSRLTAPACGVQSNGTIATVGSAAISAQAVSASGMASGLITPVAQTGAPVIPDPFASVDVSFKNTCSKKQSSTITYYSATSTTLAPGLHCGPQVVENGATLTLLPGEHYFDSDIQVMDTSVLQGSDVVLVFDPSAGFLFTQQAQVTLSGRTSGSLAGFVIATPPTNIRTFTISADHVDKLEGTVYIPKATLSVISTSRVAQNSAWTVIVANALFMMSSANLVMNANYTASPVPVPQGVGPNISGNTAARLIN